MPHSSIVKETLVKCFKIDINTKKTYSYLDDFAFTAITYGPWK